MTTLPHLSSAAFLGGSLLALELAAALAKTGTAVTIVEPDPHDAERLRSLLARAGVPVTLAPTLAQEARFELLCDSGSLPDPLLTALLGTHTAPLARLLPSAAPTTGFSLDLHRLPMLQPLLEIGLPQSLNAHAPLAHTLAAALNAHLALRADTKPSPGARLQSALWRAADDLMLQGAVLWEIDEILEEAGFAIGPYAAQDLAGLDWALSLRRLLAPNDTNPIAPRAHAEGRIGRALGWGWYRYPGGGGRVIDPLTEDLAKEESRFARVPTRDFGREEILETLTLALLVEARALRDDGLLPEAITATLRLAVGCPRTLLPTL